jgi:hypothetical protein
MKYAINTEAIILFINGKNCRIEKTDKKYPKILQVFQLPEEQQEPEVEAILNSVVKAEEVIKKTEGFDIQGDEIFYKDEKLPKAFTDKVLSIIADGLPLENFERFWENLEKNPSSASVEELIDFLSVKELPLTEDGHFIAYKGVDNNYYSIHGNLSTKVISGTVDNNGKIYNGVGEVVEVRRRDVCDDRDVGCGPGVHLGSHQYASSWGQRMVICKVNPADVVSVPKDCSYSKCRVSKYEVVGEYIHEIESSIVDSSGGETVVPNQSKERTVFIDKIANYLEKKRLDEYEQVSIRQIQNIFSPEWVTKQQVLDALQDLGEYFYEEYGVFVVDL